MGFLLLALCFGLAAVAGAALRYGFGLLIIAPWSTLTVNLIGSFLLGFLFIYLNRYSPQLRVVIGVGFLGALTTYSGFSLDMVKMLESSSYRALGLYFTLTNLGCLLGCYAGFILAKRVVATL